MMDVPQHMATNLHIAVRAAVGSYDHMAAYFPLVMGEGPLFWLNNLPAGSINS
jgi:hypothetical protein